MFKTFPDASMRQECTPANVLSAARLLSILKTVSKKDLYNYYRLGIPNNNTYFAILHRTNSDTYIRFVTWRRSD